MGSKDAKALADFPVAYRNYDQVISDLYRATSANNPDNLATIDILDLNADQALTVLNKQASVRISSLTRNDGDLMSASLEIATIAEKELNNLKAYRISAANSADDEDQLAEDFVNLRSQRQAAFSHYLELISGNQ